MMDDMLSRGVQVQIVADGAYDTYSDDELQDKYEVALQARSWEEVEGLTTEMEFREENKRSGMTRDAWVRRELSKLDKRP